MHNILAMQIFNSICNFFENKSNSLLRHLITISINILKQIHLQDFCYDEHVILFIVEPITAQDILMIQMTQQLNFIYHVLNIFLPHPFFIENFNSP